uniref:Uncharacterized protein n=1 Tax=Moniliophthora roreri TaxID=221103 RepID=A0A0W0FCW1_MONRR
MARLPLCLEDCVYKESLLVHKVQIEQIHSPKEGVELSQGVVIVEVQYEDYDISSTVRSNINDNNG